MALITLLNFHLSGSSVRNIEQNVVVSRRTKRSKKSRKSKKGIVSMQFRNILPIICETHRHKTSVDCFIPLF